MRIYIDENIKSLCVEGDNGEVLSFLKPVARLNRAQLSDDNFKEANDVIALMDNVRRKRLWDCYKRGSDIVMESDEFDLAAFKQVVLEAANEIVTVKLCDDYVSKMDVIYPLSCHDDFNDVKDVMYREATYIRSEFNELIGVIIGWKLLMPFISVYRAYRTEGSGTTQVTADLEVLQLLNGSSWLSSPGFVRFVEYIESNLNNHFGEDDNKGLTLRMTIEASDISAPDFPSLLSVAIFNRKLAVSPIVMSQEKHLISQVFYNIRSIIPSISDELSVVRKRIEQSDYGDDDDKRDYFFRYTSQIWIPDDIHVMNTVYAENVDRVLGDLNKSLPEDKQIKRELVDICLTSYSRHRPMESQTPMTLTGWVMHDLINARSIEHLDSTRLEMSRERFEAAMAMPTNTVAQQRARTRAMDEAVFSAVDRATARINLMAVTQAFLITCGLKNLAALMSAVELTKTTSGLSELQTMSEVHLLPVTNEWGEALKTRYSNAKPRSASKARNKYTNTLGYYYVQLFTRGICDIPLVLKGSMALTRQLGLRNGDPVVSSNIRNEVAELLCLLSDI